MPLKLNRQREIPSLKNRQWQGNLEPRQAQELDITPMQESDRGQLKLARLKSTKLMSRTREWTCHDDLSLPSWLMGKEESMDR
jgi:hypothetical protein